MKDTYRTIQKTSNETFFKEKGSKFYGYAYPILGEEDIKPFIEQLRKQHPTAGHFCFAWQLGEETYRFRINDDGEPNNSAGMPIYGQIQAFGLTNILLVSVRYFGGTKLGVGGLIKAYKYSAQITLEGLNVIERTIDVHYQLTFGYESMNKVMRIIKEKNITLLNQKLGLDCEYHIAIRKREVQEVLDRFHAIYPMNIKKQPSAT